MKLISLNIEQNKHYDTVLPFLKREKADVVCLQELQEDDFERFKKELNMGGVYKPFDYIHYSHYADIRGKRQGVGIFAKNIVDSGFIFYHGKEENILLPFEKFMSEEAYQKNNVLVWADVRDGSGKLFKIATMHLPVTKQGETTPFQLEVAGELLKALEAFPEIAFCGDTNAARGKEAWGRLAEKYKDNIPLKYNTSIDQNLHRVKGIQFMVDGLFTSQHYKASNVKLVDGVSDHMAIVADIEKDE